MQGEEPVIQLVIAMLLLGLRASLFFCSEEIPGGSRFNSPVLSYGRGLPDNVNFRASSKFAAISSVGTI